MYEFLCPTLYTIALLISEIRSSKKYYDDDDEPMESKGDMKQDFCLTNLSGNLMHQN